LLHLSSSYDTIDTIRSGLKRRGESQETLYFAIHVNSLTIR
jgi:hypothetical protein